MEVKTYSTFRQKKKRAIFSPPHGGKGILNRSKAKINIFAH